MTANTFFCTLQTVLKSSRGPWPLVCQPAVPSDTLNPWHQNRLQGKNKNKSKHQIKIGAIPCLICTAFQENYSKTRENPEINRNTSTVLTEFKLSFQPNRFPVKPACPPSDPQCKHTSEKSLSCEWQTLVSDCYTCLVITSSVFTDASQQESIRWTL